jgi:hypothetical protein
LCPFCKKEKNQSNIDFIPDKPINDVIDDLLDYDESAKSLVNHLESIQTDFSCSIGLIAPWGAGKTSYLNLLEKYLNLSKDKFIVIKFTPRHSHNVDTIQEEFFKMLFSELKKYDFGFSHSFNNYLKAINVISNNKIVSTLFDIHKVWNKESEKEKINKAIDRLDKRIVVIIDDFDRLLSNEIIEVFKLIDGNASFTNLIFITAYDKKYINEIIEKIYSNEESFFSDKFITQEIHIPLRPYFKTYNYLLENLLKGLFVNKEEADFYKSVLNPQYNLLSKYLVTLRDVKRFLNLFIRQYKQIQGEVEFKDYFLLSLLKYKYSDVFRKLYEKDYLTRDLNNSNRYILNESETEKMKSNDILKILFSKGSNTQRSINNVKAFNIYFHESIYDGLTIKEMESTLFEDSLEKAKSFIDKSKLENKIEDIVTFLDYKNILLFKTEEQFIRYLDLLIYINCKNYETSIPYLNMLFLLYEENKTQIEKAYSIENNSYIEIISSKIKGSFPDYPFNMTKGIIIGLINNEFREKIIFTKEDILNISKSALDNLIKNDNQIKQIHIDLLYSCITDIHQTTRVVTLDQESCSKIKELIEKTPLGYFDNFVRLGGFSTAPDWNSVACEPFWRQIFGSEQEMETFINKQDSTTISKFILIKNFWELYKNNSYKPIEFQNQGNVEEKIQSNLNKEVQDLNKLLEIEREFDEFEKDRTLTPRKKDNEYYSSQYIRLRNRIDSIELYLTKREDIIQKISNIIRTIKI